MVSTQSPAMCYHQRTQRDIGKTISKIYNWTTHFRDLRWNLTCDRTASQCVRVSCRWTLVAGRRTDGRGGGNGIAGIVVGYSGRCATTTIARVPNANAARPSVVVVDGGGNSYKRITAGRESSVVDPVRSRVLCLSLNPHSLLLLLLLLLLYIIA